MSGGHFNYGQYTIQQIADDVDQIIHDNDNKEKNQYGDTIGYNFSPETIEEFKRGLLILRQAYIYAQRIDWLVSCDDGEDSFHRRLREQLEAL